MTDSSAWLCGISMGCTTAVLLNPLDRAMYLSMVNRKTVFSLNHWKKPFKGLQANAMQRVVTVGLYFPLEDLFRPVAKDRMGDTVLANWAAGTAVGAITGYLVNPFAVVKSVMWGRPGSDKDFINTGKRMYQLGGWAALSRGSRATVLRDMVFGGVYTSLRNLGEVEALDEQRRFGQEVAAAGFATLIAGPFNYARNIQYSTPSDQKSANVLKIIGDLLKEARAESPRFAAPWLMKRMMIGWGTMRVAIGMGLSAYMYRRCGDTIRVPDFDTRNQQKIELKENLGWDDGDFFVWKK